MRHAFSEVALVTWRTSLRPLRSQVRGRLHLVRFGRNIAKTNYFLAFLACLSLHAHWPQDLGARRAYEEEGGGEEEEDRGGRRNPRKRRGREGSKCHFCALNSRLP